MRGDLAPAAQGALMWHLDPPSIMEMAALNPGQQFFRTGQFIYDIVHAQWCERVIYANLVINEPFQSIEDSGLFYWKVSARAASVLQ